MGVRALGVICVAATAACIPAPERPDATPRPIDGGADGAPPAIDGGPDAGTRCFGGEAGALGGDHVNTRVVTGPSGQQRIELIDESLPGHWTTPVFDSLQAGTRWGLLGFVPVRPSLRELPSMKRVELVSPEGNADMTGNVVLYRMEGTGLAAADWSGNGFALTCERSSCPAPVQGLYFDALEHDYVPPGADMADVLRFDANPVMFPGHAMLEPDTVTVEAWVRVTTAPAAMTRGMIFTKGHSDGPDPPQERFASYSLEVNPNRTFRCFVNVDDGSGVGRGRALDGDPSRAVTIGQWNHVACTYDGAWLRLYVNGFENAAAMYPGTLSYDVPGVDPYLYVHDVFVGGWAYGSQFLDGTVEELAVFDRPLADDEVFDHYARTALRVRVQARSCAQPQDCGDEAANPFVGPSGQPDTYYTSACALDETRNDMPLSDSDCDRNSGEDDGSSSAIPNARHVQARVYFDSDVLAQTGETGWRPQLEHFQICRE
jgi:hypothetical protein